MRRSILQFKKFRYASNPRHRRMLSIAALASCALMISWSCRIRQEFSAKTTPITKASPENGIALVFQPNPQAPKIPLATLDTRYCELETQGHELWTTQFKSAFGTHQVTLNYAFVAVGEPIHVSVDEQVFLVGVPHPFKQETLVTACQKAQSGDRELVITNLNTLTEFQAALNKAIPNCVFDQPKADGWFCRQRVTNADQSLDTLTNLHRFMVNRWNRHPYLLTRRLALSISLANALTRNDQEQELDRFCKLLVHSLREELPLAFRTETWQRSVCKNKSDQRLNAALIGLNDATKEIEVLKSEIEKNSRLGTIAVSIHGTALPSRDFWLTLTPVNTIAQPAQDSSQQGRAAQSCWHPMYGENPGFKAIASDLNLMNLEANVGCKQVVIHSTNPDNIDRLYINSSITSESEFAISNGQSKLLRLPEGEYSYSLQVLLPEESLQPANTQEATTGAISWKNNRPRFVISKW